MRLAVTAGDPRGIGPEILPPALHAFMRESPPGIAGVDVLTPLALPDLPRECSTWDVDGFDGSEAGAGRVSAQQIQRGVQMCLAGETVALVTGPVSKPALQAGGWPVPGQTEMLRDLCASQRVGMLMAAERTRLGGALRVLLATRHLPLKSVPSQVSEELLVDQARLLARDLARGWGLDRPRLALCALNPHASDGGLFGDEEARIFAPALERLRAAGVKAAGPIPADTVFLRALRGEFDAVVAPYHDVGMAAFKTAAFGSGVNVTLGLPFPRTSPDHGTAFDIAGRGLANPDSMLEALRLAASMAVRWGSARP